jgi:hypothetical protein
MHSSELLANEESNHEAYTPDDGSSSNGHTTQHNTTARTPHARSTAHGTGVRHTSAGNPANPSHAPAGEDHATNAGDRILE